MDYDRFYAFLIVALLANIVLVLGAFTGAWLYACGRQNKSPIPPLPKLTRKEPPPIPEMDSMRYPEVKP